MDLQTTIKDVALPSILVGGSLGKFREEKTMKYLALGLQIIGVISL